MGRSKAICLICNKEFERATAKKKYCGPECQRLANIKHTREKQKMRHPKEADTGGKENGRKQHKE